MSFEVLFFAMFAGGWLFGRIFERIKLPSVLGMTLWGIAISVILSLSNPNTANAWPAGFCDVVPFIKSLALVVILLRAGLGISRSDLKSAGLAAILMTFIPCLFEGFALLGLFMLLFNFPPEVAGLCAFMLAAVSPAVVVPSMLELKSKGLGNNNGVITVVLAGASADDVFAITLFTLFLGLANPGQATSGLESIALIPVSILGGLALGLILGFVLAWWFKKYHTHIRATEKALLLLASSIFLVQVGDWIHLAGLLGIMAAGFVLLERAETQAHELADKLGKIWIFAQIALFVIIGMSIDVPTALAAGPKALLALALGLIARSIGVLVATGPSKMTFKERIFCVIAYLPKATVQAALGGVALSVGLPQGQTILAIAVLAIVSTAPLGLIGIRLSSKHLLT